jgi:hypothetical protein
MPRRLPALAALILTLAACAPSATPIARQVRTYPSYRPQEISYVAGGGAMRTEILGNPFAMPQPAFDAAVTEAMRGANFGPVVTFSTLPEIPARDSHRVRLVFNGPAASNGFLLCAGEPPTLPPVRPNGTVRVLAAFCRGSEPLSFVAADQAGLVDATEPGFTRFMRQVTVLLLPPENRDFLDDDSCRPPSDC